MLDEKRKALFSAAVEYAASPGDGVAQRRLCGAAAEYQDARMSAAHGVTAAVSAAEQKRDEPVLPFGRAKGKTLSKAGKGDLEWVLGALEGSINDPAKARFLDANQALAEAVRAELARR